MRITAAQRAETWFILSKLELINIIPYALRNLKPRSFCLESSRRVIRVVRLIVAKDCLIALLLILFFQASI